MSEPLSYRKHLGAGWLTLNRPDELNSLTADLLRAISDRLEEAASDSTLKALVFTGAGRAFCAGADLKVIDALPQAERDQRTAAFLAQASTTFTAVANFPKPVIAAVNGIATAGGLELILACDIVVAAKGARIGDGHANYGLLPGAGASVRLPRRVGAARAKYLFFTGELVPAETLVAAGLVNEVVEDDKLIARAEEIVSTLATKSPLGLSRMKQLANFGLDNASEAQGLAFEHALAVLHTCSYDRNEGIAAFKGRRTPDFKGR
ncbi:enoyl-CoA hydratase/isomerase family protein [Bradyrhizobium sp. AZCC 1693]|uniref:enoyl-CoA hydratase/isomerase family protein n=1 Tax=Bradyrhizobium sp. AZCC 1693 TaxID=3117029 RepID=UPI002FF11160